MLYGYINIIYSRYTIVSLLKLNKNKTRKINFGITLNFLSYNLFS
nr:MAG TPA: hypothetical protein [Caudoviricetes sp.]